MYYLKREKSTFFHTISCVWKTGWTKAHCGSDTSWQRWYGFWGFGLHGFELLERNFRVSSKNIDFFEFIFLELQFIIWEFLTERKNQRLVWNSRIDAFNCIAVWNFAGQMRLETAYTISMKPFHWYSQIRTGQVGRIWNNCVIRAGRKFELPTE